MNIIVVGDDSHLDKVIDGLNSKFKNQEDFEFRLDVYAIEVAQKLNGLYDRLGETLMFRFGEAKLVRDPGIFLEPRGENELPN